jgi:hypothetical protein
MEHESKPPRRGQTGEGANNLDSSSDITSTLDTGRTLGVASEENLEMYRRYIDRGAKWECVPSGCGITYTSQGHMNIHTWRLAVPGGWLYKVTERDEAGHFIVQVCFVPELRVLQ